MRPLGLAKWAGARLAPQVLVPPHTVRGLRFSVARVCVCACGLVICLYSSENGIGDPDPHPDPYFSGFP